MLPQHGRLPARFRRLVVVVVAAVSQQCQGTLALGKLSLAMANYAGPDKMEMPATLVR